MESLHKSAEGHREIATVETPPHLSCIQSYASPLCQIVNASESTLPSNPTPTPLCEKSSHTNVTQQPLTIPSLGLSPIHPEAGSKTARQR